MIGNILIVLAVNVFKNMRKPFNIFHGNLAFADLLFAIATIFRAIEYVSGKTVYTEFICISAGYTIEASFTVSVLTLTVMSKDRYDAITKPLENKKTMKQNIVKMVFVWLFAFASCSVSIIAYSIETVNDQPICKNIFSSKQNLIYYSVQSAIVYFIPMIIMAFCHLKLSHVLLEKKKNIISQNLSDDARLKEHQKIKKVVQLVLILTVTFFVFWSPFIFIRIINHAGVEIHQTLNTFSHFWVFCSTVNNFIIYSLKRKDFRCSFKRLLLCGCFTRKDSTTPSAVVKYYWKMKYRREKTGEGK